jgi:R3H domain
MSSGRKKGKYIPEELHHLWDRDRAKKAERKRLRELERFAAAANPFAFKGGKKARKARLAAASAVPVNLGTVVRHMRQFVADIRGSNTLPLPPMDRKVRKSVHELAHAFKLKSKSEGNGATRFTVLKKTRFSGVGVDEKKIAWILGMSPSSYVTHGDGKAKGRVGKIRPRDGEVVGEVWLLQAFPDSQTLCNDFLSCQGRTEAGRVEPRVPYVICYGVGRGRPDRS